MAKIGPAAHDALPVLLKSTPDCLSSCPTGEVFAAIGAIDSAGATIPQLIPFIKKRCPGVFTTLCIMGSRKHDMALLDTLLKNLPHDDGEVAKLALYGKDVIPLLYPALQGQAPDNGPRISEALTILQALGPESAPAIPRLIVLLKKVIKDDESDSYTAVKIVELLGTIGEAAAPACPVLADLLVEGDGGLWNTMQMDLIVNPSGINIEGAKRMRAAPGPLDESDPSGGPTIAELGEAIEKLDRTDLGRFISIMKGEDITLATKTALDSIGEKAVPHIQPLFKHKRWDVRWQAADVVREIGPSAVLMCVPALTTLAADPYSFVRWRAVQALQKLDPLPENVKRVLARRIDVESDEELADTLRNIIQGR